MTWAWMLGPVSSAAPGGPGALFIAFVLFLCLLVVVDWVREHNRRAGLRALAARRGFSYLGASLPKSFTLGGTPFAAATEVWSVLDADCNGVRVICFDCRVGSGKGSWRRTVIAAKATPLVFSHTMSPPLAVDQCGEWSFMYEPRRMSFIPGWPMGVSEIESHLDAIRR